MTEPLGPQDAPDPTGTSTAHAELGHSQQKKTNSRDTSSRWVTRTAFVIGGVASVGSIIALAGINLGPHQMMTLTGILIVLLAGIAWIAAFLVVCGIILRTWWTSRRRRKEQVIQDPNWTRQ